MAVGMAAIVVKAIVLPFDIGFKHYLHVPAGKEDESGGIHLA